MGGPASDTPPPDEDGPPGEPPPDDEPERELSDDESSGEPLDDEPPREPPSIPTVEALPPQDAPAIMPRPRKMAAGTATILAHEQCAKP
jgi:hypothetical protein